MSAVLIDEDERTPRTCNRRRKRIAVLATVLSVALLPVASAVMTSYEISSADDGIAARAEASVDAAGEAAFPLPLTGGVGQPGGADGDSGTDAGTDGARLGITRDAAARHVETPLIGAQGPEVRSAAGEASPETGQMWLIAALVGLGVAAVATVRRVRA